MSRRTASISLALFLIHSSMAAAATPATVEGDWIGGFDAQDGTVFISARLERKGETLTGEIDLPVRGDRKIPLQNISANDSRLSFEVPGAGGNLLFEGRHQNGKMSGSVRQARSSSRFELIKLFTATSETIAQIAGNYELAPGRVILIARSASGAIYLDHAANRMGVLYPIGERTFVSGPSLIAGFPVELTVTFDEPPVAPMPTLRADDAAGAGAGDGSGEGAGNGAGTDKRVNGGPSDSGEAAAWSIASGGSMVRMVPGDYSAPKASVSPGLTWHVKGQAPLRAVRKTFYTTTPVRYASGSTSLSGSLLTPLGPGPHPAIVMIHGSGAVTRDALMPYADVFVRNGIAVLIHDKRGTGSSTGNWARASFDDLAGDALAGVKLLKGRPEINPAQIGLQGTSLGGWVAPLAASRSADVAFVIVESAPALTPLEHEKLRVRSQLRADGFNPPAVMQALAFMDQKFDVARTGKGWDRLQSSMTRNAQSGWMSYVNAPTSLESLQWHWDNVLSYDPLPALEKLTCPVLVLYGELDTIVPADENKKRMEAVLKRSGTRDTTIKVFERANHGFFEAINGGKREAAGLKGLVPGYLDSRVAWLRQRVNVATATVVAPAAEPGITQSEEPAAPLSGPRHPSELMPSAGILR
jgi:pimeloyl-ACP methyl ester carboxylesterase